MPDGDPALRLRPEHDLADRLHDLLPDRGDVRRQPIRADDAWPRQRRHPAALHGAEGAPAARVRLELRHYRLRPHPRRPDLQLLDGGVGAALGIRHDVAGAVVDSVLRDADRAHAPYAPGNRRADPARETADDAFRHARLGTHGMSPTQQGLLVLVVTLAMLLSGVPVAFGLGALSIAFLVLFQGFDALRVVAETFYAGLNDFTLVSIPMFVMMGAAIGSSPAGKDLYEALDRWLYRLPGGLVISNLGACAIFAALTGSSPACCAAIGKMGIPEMRRRGYPDDVATGSICAGGTLGILIPPSITFILYGIATETSIGRLFLAGVVPGIMLTLFFMIWTLFIIWKRGFRGHAADFRYSWREKFGSIPKILPFLVIVVGVMYVLYGGVATPSEAAGVGAALCFVLAVSIYRMWRPVQWWQILRDTTRESVM